MKVTPVSTPRQMRQFLKFPWRIYAKDKNWVPPLLSDMRFVLGKNPFWEHAERELFIAYDDRGVPIGRIAAIIDRHYISFQNEKVGFFGFYESIDDQEVAKALYHTAQEWLRKRDILIMRGPMNPSTNDESGFLCEGFDTPARIMMPHTPAYYLSLAESSGLSKVKELYAYDMEVASGPLQRLDRLTQIAYKKNPGLSVRQLNIKDFHNEIDRAIAIYNAAWEKNWGFVPWTDKEFHTIASRLKDLLLLETTLIAEINGKPVGMLIAVPDYNQVLRHMNGRLWPFGFLKFLYYRGKIDALRLMIMGVVKEYRQRGIEGVMYDLSLRNALKKSFRKCEFSWILDDNIMTQRAAEMMGGKRYKRYRIYEGRA